MTGPSMTKRFPMVPSSPTIRVMAFEAVLHLPLGPVNGLPGPLAGRYRSSRCQASPRLRNSKVQVTGRMRRPARSREDRMEEDLHTICTRPASFLHARVAMLGYRGQVAHRGICGIV